MRGGGGEKYQKISLIKMSLFMVGGEGLIEIGTKSLSLLFYFFEGLPKVFHRYDVEIVGKLFLLYFKY